MQVHHDSYMTNKWLNRCECVTRKTRDAMKKAAPGSRFFVRGSTNDPLGCLYQAATPSATSLNSAILSKFRYW